MNLKAQMANLMEIYFIKVKINYLKMKIKNFKVI